MAWTEIANLRGPAGYNATGAAEDDAAIAAFVKESSGPTLVGAALRTSLEPTYATLDPQKGLTGTGRYDPATGIYGADRVPRKSMAALLAAPTTRKKILCVGHSLVGGSGGTTPWPTALRGFLSATIPQNTGVVFTTQGTSPVDPQWAFNAGWTPFDSSYTMFVKATSVGATATFTSNRTGTIVDIWTVGTSAAVSYKIDGGSAVNTVPNSTNSPQLTSITGLANTVHTVVITTTSASNSFLIGVEVRQATGLSITNMGAGGTLTYQWVSDGTWYSNGPMSIAYAPDITFIQIMTNDAANAIPVATFKANLTTMVNRYKAFGEVFLIVDPQPNPVAAGSYAAIPEATWLPYRQAVYQVADSYAGRVLDVNGYLGTYDKANANGLMADSFHMNNAGYAAEAHALDRLMCP